jgi:hypothetical protein
MNLYECEIFDLDTSWSTSLSGFKPFATLAFGLIILVFSLPLILSVFTFDWSIQPTIWELALCVAFIILGFSIVLLGLSLVIQAMRNLFNAVIGSIRLNMTPTHLLIGKFELLWSEIDDLRYYFSRQTDGPCYSYLAVISHEADRFTFDPTRSSSVVYFWRHRREFFKTSKCQQATTIFVPIDFFDAGPDEIHVLARRYWSKAKGNNYVPGSLELMYPQKKFSDYKK